MVPTTTATLFYEKLHLCDFSVFLISKTNVVNYLLSPGSLDFLPLEFFFNMFLPVVNRLVSSSNGLVGVRERADDTFCIEPWRRPTLSWGGEPFPWGVAEALRGRPPGNGIGESKGGVRMRLRGVRQRPMLTGDGQAEWLRWYEDEEEDL